MMIRNWSTKALNNLPSGAGCLLVLALGLTSVQAQEIAAEKPVTQSVRVEAGTLPEPLGSDAMESGTKDKDAMQIHAIQDVAPFLDNVAGSCEVVNGFLGDFCSANPMDAGCQALMQ